MMSRTLAVRTSGGRIFQPHCWRWGDKDVVFSMLAYNHYIGETVIVVCKFDNLDNKDGGRGEWGFVHMGFPWDINNMWAEAGETYAFGA